MSVRLSFPRVICVLLVLVSLAGGLWADDRGEGPLNPNPPTGITVDQIIQKFASKEKEFKAAREKYTWRQSVMVATVDGDTIDGQYREVFDVLFDSTGKRIEQVVFAPQNTLERIQMTPEDMQDIRKLMPFVLTSDEVPEYNITYAGQQKEDELNTYVFDISPKKIEKGKRYFEGRVWVDDHDMQIVKTYGKAVPDIKKGQENLFPKFTTWREQIDGLYWFPAYTKADDDLHFKEGDVHTRQIIRYTNYKRFGAATKITFDGQEVQRKPEGQDQQQTPQQQPQQQAPPKL
ncbi:MAG TPA: hypothetical protein VGL89_10460 [Candidatus Koribacter sp.]|jgi:hypothetical protein